MWKKRKTPYGFFVLTFLLCLAAGYYISGIFLEPGLHLENIGSRLEDVVTHPFRNYWNEKSPACVLSLLLVWLYGLTQYQYKNRNFQFAVEDGSAEWADPKMITKSLAGKDPKENRILSQHVQVAKRALSNNNMMLIGSPGTGKSTGLVIPNLLTASASYVFLDVKGELLEGFGNYLKENGYLVKCLNLKEMEKSDQLNPFLYVGKEEDIIKLVSVIHVNTTPPDAMKGDPFWDDGLDFYLLSLFYYVWLEYPKEEQNMNKILDLCNKEAEVVDKDGTTTLGIMMERLTLGKRGKSHPAYVKYNKLKAGHEETVKSIVLMVNTKFKFFETPGVRRIFEGDTLDLASLGTGKNHDGKTKTALFLVIPDNDPSFNFVMGMLYSLLFDTLIRTADLEYHGPLPIPVEVWMDEFANGARPDRFENLITTLRSRNISAVITLQSVDQAKTIYKGDTWGILMDACSTFVFLGAGRGAVTTHEYISKLLGSATIDKRSEGENRGHGGSSNLGFDRKGRELMNASEVGRMPKEKCIILLEGQQPILDDKIRPFHDKTFLYAKSLGSYKSPVVVKERPDGSYETVKASGSMEQLSKSSLMYYREQEQQGKAVIFELDEEEFLQMDFSQDSVQPELDPEKVRQLLDQMREEKTEEEPQMEEPVLQEDLFELVKKLDLSDAQFEEVVGGMEDGLTDEQIKAYLYLDAEKMHQMRRYFFQKNKREGRE